MIRKNPRGDYPQIDKTAYIDPQAVIIGNVKIGKKAFVAPGAVIRADEPGSSVVIGSNCNVQDRVVIHALGGSSVRIGNNTSLSHGCIVHGPCKIGRGCFIGFGAVAFGAELGDDTVVKHLAVVEALRIEACTLVPSGAVIDSGQKAAALTKVPKAVKQFCAGVVKANAVLVKGYCSG